MKCVIEVTKAFIPIITSALSVKGFVLILTILSIEKGDDFAVDANLLLRVVSFLPNFISVKLFHGGMHVLLNYHAIPANFSSEYSQKEVHISPSFLHNSNSFRPYARNGGYTNSNEEIL